MLGLRRKTVSSAPKITLTYAHRTTVSALKPAAASELAIRMRADANAARATMDAEKELL
jgi:hypothetical protein